IYQDPPFHETAIGCERCHGPAADHVAMHERSSSADGSDPIINPVNLEPDRRESVCYQCHLEAAARVLRPGRTHLDFRPGMLLSDVWAILDQGTDVSSGGRTRSVNHVQQMRDSVCFRQSDGKMGCISCHDPHRLPPAEEKAAFYRQRCVSCHSDRSCSLPLAQRQEKQDDCVACHMPSLNSKNMAHIAQTDHRILRRPLEPADQPGAESRAVSLTYFGDAAERLPQPERQRGLLLGTYIHCKRKGIPIPSSLMLYLEEVLRLFPQDVAVLDTLGAVAAERNDLAAARNYYQKAVDADPSDENALDGLLGAAYATADWSLCSQCATRLLKIDPSNARVYALRGDALMHLGRASEGITDIERAVELNPGVIPLREWLVEQYRQHGLNEKLDEQSRQLERVRNARIPKSIAESKNLEDQRSDIP
ncbi:MAG: tetratricopeptide repeat protein, partial [Aureliella sp.]